MTTIARLIALVAALLLVPSCGGQGDSSGDEPSGPKMPETPVITGEPAGYNSADVVFATQMVPHHQQAIDMSTLALEHTTTPELIAVANQIVATQQPEVNILNVFLVQWNENPDIRTDAGGADAAPEPSIQGMIDDATVAKLESLHGAEFDKLWLQSMIGQHQGGVDMARDEIADGQNVDAIAIAQTIAAGLEPQIAQMKQMLEGMP